MKFMHVYSIIVNSVQELAPVAAKYDESGEFPWDIVKKAHALGIMNPQIPEAYGMYFNHLQLLNNRLINYIAGNLMKSQLICSAIHIIVQ